LVAWIIFNLLKGEVTLLPRIPKTDIPDPSFTSALKQLWMKLTLFPPAGKRRKASPWNQSISFMKLKGSCTKGEVLAVSRNLSSLPDFLRNFFVSFSFERWYSFQEGNLELIVMYAAIINIIRINTRCTKCT
jgi:hypothetical protein